MILHERRKRKMSRDDHIELEGVVTAVSHGIYTVTVNVEGSKEPVNVTCTLGGRLRQNYIRVLLNDQVTIEVSPYDLKNGKITYRKK